MLIDNISNEKIKANFFNKNAFLFFNFIQLIFVFLELEYTRIIKVQLTKKKQKI